jgi:hypothetical protein
MGHRAHHARRPPFDVEQDISLIKAGINYRFGAPALMARY